MYDFKFEQLRVQDKPSYQALVNKDDNFIDRLTSLLKQIIYFDDNDLYFIALGLLLTPSALSNNLPIIFCYGKSGSGKSTFGRFASYLYGVTIKSPDDTVASLRRNLDIERYLIPENKEGEKNTILIWDDIDINLLNNNLALLRLLKVGYDRSSSEISIATQGRETISFNVFCSKVISSITNILLFNEFKELTRRTLILPFKKASVNLINDKFYNWTHLNVELQAFWTLTRARKFINYQLIVSQELQKLNNWSIDRQQLMTDIIATLCLTELLELPEIILLFDNYFKWLNDYLKSSQDNLTFLITQYVKDQTSSYSSIGIKTNIKASDLKNKILVWKNEGMVNQQITPNKITQIMSDLGFQLRDKHWSEKID